jgi:hypothetical protein
MFFFNIILVSILSCVRTSIKIFKQPISLDAHDIDVNLDEFHTVVGQFDLTWTFIGLIYGTVSNGLLFQFDVPGIVGWILAVIVSLLIEIMTVIIINYVYPNSIDRRIFARQLLKKKTILFLLSGFIGVISFYFSFKHMSL